MSSIPPEPTKEEINRLRNAAKQKIDQLGAGSCDNRDVSRIMQDDDYIRRFLMHHDNDQNLALEMVIDTLKWRKEQAVNDITADTVNQKFFDLANLFIHNRDTDGFRMLIFIVSKHTKGVNDIEELKKYFIYWLERLEREEYGKWMTVFFDMRDTGMKNMDMEFIQYMINLFKCYYPWILNNIIVFEMPWLLNAMWKIIKTWLPPKSVEKIKFVNKSALSQYVAKDQALTAWGGTDDYQFRFEPEVMQPPPWRAQQPDSDIRKQVHFSESTASSVPAMPQAAALAQNAAGSLLQLSPSDELVFDCSRQGATASLTLLNPGTAPVYFKVKTTSPDKFRVRPSVGALAGGGRVSVSVAVLPSDQPQATISPALLVREKFLVMALVGASDSASPQDISSVFKSAPKESMREVRLRVGVSSSVDTQNGIPPQHTPAEAQMLAKLEELVRGQQRLEGQLNSSRRLMLVLLALLVALVVGVAMGGSRLLEQCSVPLLDGLAGVHDHQALHDGEL